MSIKIKISVIVVFLLTAIINQASSQTEQISSKIGFGFQINQYQKDFGLGLTVTSPYFASNHVAFRLRANYMYFEHVKGLETIWTPYTNISLGVIGVAGNIGNNIRLYGEGGILGIMPSGDFSSEDFVMGGYGIFGFEFYFLENLNYFIELGGVGSGAIADKIITKPIYSNGFLISTGFRVQLK